MEEKKAPSVVQGGKGCHVNELTCGSSHGVVGFWAHRFASEGHRAILLPCAGPFTGSEYVEPCAGSQYVEPMVTAIMMMLMVVKPVQIRMTTVTTMTMVALVM